MERTQIFSKLTNAGVPMTQTKQMYKGGLVWGREMTIQ